MARRVCIIGCAVVRVPLLAATIAEAAGEHDPTFGVNGTVVTPIELPPFGRVALAGFGDPIVSRAA